MQETKKASIRCGSCKGTHATVAEVRECFGKVKERPATPGMVSYCQSLLRQREPTEEFLDITEDRVNAFSYKEAAHFIDTMKPRPRRSKHQHMELTHPEVPEGYYALRQSDEVIDFYKLVDWRDDQRLLFQVYGSPGSLRENRVTRPELAEFVMESIAKDPQAASILFGKKLKICGRCGSPLTKKKSRDAGIGPDCAKKEW
jgi:hypothetical protein